MDQGRELLPEIQKEKQEKAKKQELWSPMEEDSHPVMIP